jgi:hypothetical protein
MDLFCCSASSQLIKLPVIIDGGGGAGAKNQTYIYSPPNTHTSLVICVINIDVNLQNIFINFLCRGIYPGRRFLIRDPSPIKCAGCSGRGKHFPLKVILYGVLMAY